ncbi:MAG: hypothetical protein Q8L48_28445 [Archangium sp.]|nr:hypothetical protein [Archangium sp.]
MKKQTEGELPPQLIALLDGVIDRELAARLGDVMAAAGRCIERLAGINLVALEPKEWGEGSADLALWEKMAPAVGETVVAVNELCAVIDESFPPARSRSSMFGEDGSDQRAEYEAAAVFRAIGPLIQKEVVEVGAIMRRPELLSSPWSLLAELQRLRSDIRARVSDGVYLSAAALGAVSREDVVPGFAQEVMRALSFRGTEAALRRTARQRLESTTTPGAKLAKSLEEDFEVFTAMPAWRHVKIETKREMLELRLRLAALATDETTTPVAVRDAVDPLLGVLAATSFELSRRLLIAHDRQARNLALRRAEQAELHLTLGTGAAGWALEAAFDAAAPLRGCNEQVDELMRGASKSVVGELPESDLMPLAADFAAALSRLDL